MRLRARVNSLRDCASRFPLGVSARRGEPSRHSSRCLRSPASRATWTRRWISSGVTLAAKKDVTRLAVKTSLAEMEKPVNLTVAGSAKIGDRELVHEAVPAEDRMQAFLWRHLLPAENLPALTYNPSYVPPADRVRPPIRDEDRPKGVKRTLTKSSVARRLGEIERLYQLWFFTDEFANRQIASIEALVVQ